MIGASSEFRCSARHERRVRRQGYRFVAGVDEAGRGCLYGPVYAAAVIMDPERTIRGLNDSKQLDAEIRDILAGRIRERAVAWAVASSDAVEIDRINILQAARLAMRRAVEQLTPTPDFLLVDATTVEFPVPQEAVIHGDALCTAIAAASILAKTARDAAMLAAESLYPGYGLAKHKGYCTPEHLDALRRLGPTPQHRFTFEPLCGGQQLTLFAEAGGA